MAKKWRKRGRVPVTGTCRAIGVCVKAGGAPPADCAFCGQPGRQARLSWEGAAARRPPGVSVEGAPVVVWVTYQYANGIFDSCRRTTRMFYTPYRRAIRAPYTPYRRAIRAPYMLYRRAIRMFYTPYRRAIRAPYMLCQLCLLYRRAIRMFYTPYRRAIRAPYMLCLFLSLK